MENEKRTFSILKGEKTEIEFENFCATLAERYANSDLDYARAYFCNEYNISQSCYYKCLEYAVVHYLIDDVTFAKMEAKAAANQNRHFSGAGGTSLAKYKRLYGERCKEIASSLPEKTIKDIAEDFGYEPDINKYSFSQMYDIPQLAVDFALEKAIVENIVDDETVAFIEKRSIENAPYYGHKKAYVQKFFEALKIRRTEDKQTKEKKEMEN